METAEEEGREEEEKGRDVRMGLWPHSVVFAGSRLGFCGQHVLVEVNISLREV
jgi:hypothetical protein